MGLRGFKKRQHLDLRRGYLTMLFLYLFNLTGTAKQSVERTRRDKGLHISAKEKAGGNDEQFAVRLSKWFELYNNLLSLLTEFV